MGNYTVFYIFENLRRGRQARNWRKNDPKILDLKSSSEQVIFRKLSLGAPDICLLGRTSKGARSLKTTFYFSTPKICMQDFQNSKIK